MNEALDSIAPIKNFTIKDNYVHGLSEDTESLMNERDNARRQVSSSKTALERQIKMAQY